MFLSGTRETIPPTAPTPKGHSDLRGRVLPRPVLVFQRGVVKLNQPLSLSVCVYVCVCIKSAILFSRLKAVRLLWLRMRVRGGGVMGPREAGKQCDRYCHEDGLHYDHPDENFLPGHPIQRFIPWSTGSISLLNFHCCTYLCKGLLPPEFVSTLFVSQVRRHLLGNGPM